MLFDDHQESEAPLEPKPAGGGGDVLSQAQIDALLASMLGNADSPAENTSASKPKPEEAKSSSSSAVSLSQDELNALFDDGPLDDSPPPQAAQKNNNAPASSASLTQEELEALFKDMEDE